MDAICFKVVRARDGVMLASFDNWDAAYSYACAVVPFMGDCNVVAAGCEEE